MPQSLNEADFLNNQLKQESINIKRNGTFNKDPFTSPYRYRKSKDIRVQRQSDTNSLRSRDTESNVNSKQTPSESDSNLLPSLDPHLSLHNDSDEFNNNKDNLGHDDSNLNEDNDSNWNCLLVFDERSERSSSASSNLSNQNFEVGNNTIVISSASAVTSNSTDQGKCVKKFKSKSRTKLKASTTNSNCFRSCTRNRDPRIYSANGAPKDSVRIRVLKPMSQKHRKESESELDSDESSESDGESADENDASHETKNGDRLSKKQILKMNTSINSSRATQTTASKLNTVSRSKNRFNGNFSGFESDQNSTTDSDGRFFLRKNLDTSSLNNSSKSGLFFWAILKGFLLIIIILILIALLVLLFYFVYVYCLCLKGIGWGCGTCFCGNCECCCCCCSGNGGEFMKKGGTCCDDGG